MKFLVDAQLPPALAARLTAAGHPSWHIGELVSLDTPDAAIRDIAIARGCAIITKDADFLQICRGKAQPVLWVRVGNCNNARLVEILLTAVDTAAVSFAAGETIVEIR